MLFDERSRTLICFFIDTINAYSSDTFLKIDLFVIKRILNTTF